MLDDQTKARINSARDILVGKVPDPKSQVEQITIALIYKFMDDMDRQSEELGGKASFFSDGFKKYAWHKLIDPRLSGHERLMIYAEGLEKMNENKHIPQLFRDIFKGVFLPYRDPETLNLFLKQINEFSYDHSEQLGDAFEYLLSVLGSQGDAGQFRTPRHIIDFIVRIVDPKKNETVLDPACGTAGFLISAYKHILAANSREGKGDLLSGDERGRLMGNFCGYDISPDMVRLSRANMYLHGFSQPRIHEYDTLTSEERWDERYDVVMANPPFMTPKGGIRPHNRFSIKATRSEVLFVDYIAEHLNVNGRAGVIVPEGIIFQSQTAYKSLRKMLVENYLWCVVSLPAGVFNPYSGVKTCILLMDKALAKSTDEILFVKIENDGFGLGAQRRVIAKNDLPEAQEAIQAWKLSPRDDKNPLVHAVQRKRIFESVDCNLSGERYRKATGRSSMKWPMMRLGDLAETISGQSPEGKYYNAKGEGLPFYQGKADFGDTCLQYPLKWTTQITRVSKFNDILMSVRAPVGPVNMNPFAEICIGRGLAAIRPKASAHPWYIFYILQGHQDTIQKGSGGSTFDSINRNQIEDLDLPFPPLNIQQNIVAELDGYRNIIEGAKQVIANYKPNLPIHPDWPTMELSEVIEEKPKNGYSGKPVPYSTNLKVLTLTATTSGKLDISRFKFLDEDIPLDSPLRCKRGDIYLQRGNTKELVGTAALFDVDDRDFIYPDLMIRVRADERKVLPEFLLHTLQSQPVREFVTKNASGSAGSMPKINQGIVERIPISLPPLVEQRRIVTELETERNLVEANRELIVRFEKRIQVKLSEIWGDEENE